MTTSVDAAVRFRTPTGEVEVALIEWKYTEDYTGHELSGGVEGLERRMKTYRDLWDDPESPILRDSTNYGDLFVEPRYQLFRQQLLADQMERSHELDADRVRLVVATPGANCALTPDLRRWPRLLRSPDRFSVLHTDKLLATDSRASTTYRARYG